MASRLRFYLGALITLLVLLFAGPAEAHKVGLSRGEYQVGTKGVEATLIFSRRELSEAVPGLDADADDQLTQTELDASAELLTAEILNAIVVTADNRPCPARFLKVTLEHDGDSEKDGVAVAGLFECDTRANMINFELEALMAKLSRGHRHVAFTHVGAVTIEHMTFQQQSRFRVHVETEAAQADADEAGALQAAWNYFVLGVEHIVIGIDHLAFLFGLILLGGRLRPTLLMITAFTIAHSITLGAAALNLVALSPRIVEPVIALSVAYVGVENFFLKDPSKRWRITFPFGLIHGFGFAGVLGEIGLPKGQVPVALASFNVGVEAGQLAILAVVLPIVLKLRTYPAFRNHGVKALSAGIAVAGLVWFVTRVIG